MAGAAAFRGIAGDIEEITFLMTAGTHLWGLGRSNGVVAVAAAPVCQAALGADIPDKLA